MITIDGTNNWKLTVQRSAESVTILRAVTCDKKAALPDELFGLPVKALSDRALAPGAAALPGEEVLIRHGPGNEEWDNKNLEALTLPRSLEAIGNYAFMNCRSLRELCLPAALSHPGASLFMNCRDLQFLTLEDYSPENGEMLSCLLRELKESLDISFHTADGKFMRLIFPEYYEQLTENEPTHFFNYTIEGGGYPYHIVCRNKRLYLSDYDAIFKKYIFGAHDDASALRLAWMRLRYPEGLSDAAKRDYSEYLAAHLSAALCLAVEMNDLPGLSCLISTFSPSGEEMAAASCIAREKHCTEATALFLEKSRSYSRGLNKNYDL